MSEPKVTPLLALVSYLALAYLVLRRAVSSRLQHTFALYLLLMAIWSLGSALQRLDPTHIVLWNKVTTGSTIAMALAFYAFVLVFLDEKNNHLLWAGLASGAALQVANAAGLLVEGTRLLEGGLLSFELQPLGYLMSLWSACYLMASIFWLARAQHRTTNQVRRNRILYPLVGGTVVLTGGMSNLIDVLSTYPIDHAANLLNAVLLTYAVLRYHLVDISLVVRKGLLYTIPTATLGVAYFLLVTLATSLFHALTGLQILVISQLVENMQDMLERIIGENIEFRISPDPNLASIRLDPSQMEQVIMNLVVNARDAMSEGGRLDAKTENVQLDSAFAESHPDVEPGEYVLLMISDTGVGVTEEVISHIFEPFFTTKERGQGTGLGLSTVFGIVKQNQGHIDVESDVGRGTTFWIYLPQVKVTAVDLAEGAQSPEPARSPQGSGTILVVEDAADGCHLTVQTLRDHGYQVLVASNGVQALEVSNQYRGPIHLLLTDLVMPKMGGTS